MRVLHGAVQSLRKLLPGGTCNLNKQCCQREFCAVYETFCEVSTRNAPSHRCLRGRSRGVDTGRWSPSVTGYKVRSRRGRTTAPAARAAGVQVQDTK